jgi:hypothetical protein
MLKEHHETESQHGEENQSDEESEKKSHRKNSGLMEKPRLNDSPGAIF